MLYKRSRSEYRYQNGPFSIVPNLPGYAIPEHRDHGYGPLARFDDTTLEPGGFVPMHEHRNDEIITYITDGLGDTSTALGRGSSRARPRSW
jgi:redox-sensitive bicupin YhaK (pirin superfamily)